MKIYGIVRQDGYVGDQCIEDDVYMDISKAKERCRVIFEELQVGEKRVEFKESEPNYFQVTSFKWMQIQVLNLNIKQIAEEEINKASTEYNNRVDQEGKDLHGWSKLDFRNGARWMQTMLPNSETDNEEN